MELYNRAYKLDPDVELHINYDTEELVKKEEAVKEQTPPVRKNNPLDMELYSHIQNAVADSKNVNIEAKNPSTSANIFVISCTQKNNLLDELPEDVLDKVLECLGATNLPSLETVSNASRALYLACRKESLWRALCFTKKLSQNVDSWRYQYIMKPRFRTDGLYISKITYFRQGYAENSMNLPTHLVTYYRYLRFYNSLEIEGNLVMAFVTTEKPKAVIDFLRFPDEKCISTIKERFFSKSYSNGVNNNKNRNSRSSRSRHQTVPNLFIGSYWQEAEPSSLDTHLEPTVDPERCFHLLLFDAHSANPMRLSMRMRVADDDKGPASRSAQCASYCGKVEHNNAADESSERIDFDIHNWNKFYFSRVKSYLS